MINRASSSPNDMKSRGSIGAILDKFEQTLDTNRQVCGVERDPFGNLVAPPVSIHLERSKGRRYSMVSMKSPTQGSSLDGMLVKATSGTVNAHKTDKKTCRFDEATVADPKAIRDELKALIGIKKPTSYVSHPIFSLRPPSPSSVIIGTIKDNEQPKKEATIVITSSTTATDPEFEEDEEMFILRQRIAYLKCQLEHTQQAEKTELRDIECQKKERIAHYHTRSFRRHSMNSPSQATACVLKTRRLCQYAKQQRSLIQKLRQSNKELRQDMFKMAAKMALLQQENAELEEDLAQTQVYVKEIQKHCESEKLVYERYNNEILPLYRSSIQNMTEKVEAQTIYMEMEEARNVRYKKVVKEIMKKVLDGCQEYETKKEVHRDFLRLCTVA